MPGAAPLNHIAETLREAVANANLPTAISRLLMIPLTQPGKVLSGVGHPLWPATVLACCAAAHGDEAHAIPVAAAVEIFMAGLDVLDEIEDGDASPTAGAAGAPQAINVATALILLAHQVVLDLQPRGIPPALALELAAILTRSGLTATGGQHVDLAATGSALVTGDDALAIARQKAGALVGGACRLGARLGTADADLLDRYEAWGRHFGTAMQLSNDLHDATNVTSKSDSRQGKPTLPLLYSRVAGDSGDRRTAGITEGALQFTWVVLEVERQHCARISAELAARGQDIAPLNALLAL